MLCHLSPTTLRFFERSLESHRHAKRAKYVSHDMSIPPVISYTMTQKQMAYVPSNNVAAPNTLQAGTRTKVNKPAAGGKLGRQLYHDAGCEIACRILVATLAHICSTVCYVFLPPSAWNWHRIGTSCLSVNFIRETTEQVPNNSFRPKHEYANAQGMMA